MWVLVILAVVILVVVIRRGVRLVVVICVALMLVGCFVGIHVARRCCHFLVSSGSSFTKLRHFL